MSINKRIFVCTVLLALVAFMFYVFNNREADGFISVADGIETIYIWYTDDALTDYLNSAAVAYMETNEIRVVPVLNTGLDYLESINDASLSGSEIPDLFIIGTDRIEQAAMTGLATPVTDSLGVLNYMNYPEIAIRAVTYDDRKYGYPFYYETAFMLYNRTYLEWIADTALRSELGLTVSENTADVADGEDTSDDSGEDSDTSDASDDGSDDASDDSSEDSGEEQLSEEDMIYNDEGDIPDTVVMSEEAPEGYDQATWDALVDEKVASIIPTSVEGIKNFASNYSAPEGAENIFLWDVNDIFYNYFFAGAYMNVCGINGDDPGVIEIYNDDTVACMQMYQGLNQYFSIDAATSSYENVLDSFISGKTLFIIATSDALAKLDMAKHAGDFQWDYSVASLPAVDSDHEAVGLSTTNAIILNGFSTHGSEADDFARFVSNEYIDTFFARTGKLPAVNGQEDYVVDATDLVRDMYKQSVQLPKLLGLGNFWIELERTYTLIWEGEDPDTSVLELQQEMEEQLAP